MKIYSVNRINPAPAFRATSNNSRIDFHPHFDLSDGDITYLDNKVLIGRAPGEPQYSSNSCYNFNPRTLLRDLEFLNIHKNVGVIFDLRNPKYESEKCIEAEREACQKYRINYINFPMDAAIVPTQEELDIFFNTINNTEQKVYVHCHAGKDRTGLMASCYLAKKYGLNREEIFRKVFDSRQVQRLYYMSNHPEECEKFFTLLQCLAKK